MTDLSGVRRMTVAAIAALVFMSAGALSCTGSSGPAEESLMNRWEPVGLPGLPEIFRQSAAPAGVFKNGSDFSSELASQRVQVAETSLDYLAGGPYTYSHASFAIYQFDLSGESGELDLVLDWYRAPPPSPVNPTLWLGLSDWGNDSWDWYAPLNTSLLPVEAVAPYVRAETGGCFVAVVALGYTEPRLDSIGFPGAGPEIFTAGGIVTDNTGAPRMLLEMNLTGDATDTAITGPDGTYTFRGLQNGSYQVTPSSGNYEPANHLFTVDGADVPDLDFQEPLGADPPNIHVVYYTGPGLIEFTSIIYKAGVSGTPPFEYQWDFAGAGDPNTSTDAEPTILLNAAGEYKWASLTVTNAYGSDVLPWIINVLPAS